MRSQSWRLLVLYASAWTAAVLIAAVVALGLADYLIRYRDHGIRLMASLAVLLVAAWAVRRYWLANFARRWSDVELAHRIERRYPALADRLASTVEFLKQSEDDPTAGSAVLRRAVILETANQVETVDLAEVFDRRAARRAIVAAGFAALVALALVLASPESARIAVARLVHPLGSDIWPRVYRVEFRQPPARLAAGQSFEVELINDADHHLPDVVRIHYRYDSASGGEEDSETMQSIGGTRVARKEHVVQPFWYRAEGGDDTSMPWMRLEVLEPPRLDALELKLHPPDYTALPVESSEKSILAIRGTRVALAGTSTKKLRSARVRLDGGAELPAVLAADGYGFSLAADAAEPLVVDKSGPYWIILEDVEGLTGGADEHFELRAIADEPPTVNVEQPAANIFVTPQAEVPLVIAAKDDLALASVGLHFNRSDRSDVEDFAVPLFQGPARAEPPDEPGALAAGRLGQSERIEHRWELGPLQLKPGAQVTFWATAGDYLPQVGKSTVRKLSIITPQELEERLAQRQALVFAELERVLKLQQDARGQTRSLEIQLNEVGRLDKQDVDRAQSAELNQRQVKRSLTSSGEGIQAQIADFLADLANNRVDSPDLERHMRAVSEELDRLGQEHLSTIERELTSLIKAAQLQTAGQRESAQSRADTEAQLKESLTATAENQDQVIGSLEKLLGELSQWDNYRRFAREIAALGRQQQEIARATKEIGPQTLGRETKELEPQQQADLKKLAQEQTDLSRRLEKVQQQMSAMTKAGGQSDPIAAATVSDGLHHAQRQAIAGRMRRAGEQLERNQLGQAAEGQSKIAKDLDDLLSILANRREQELGRLVKQLREAERELAAMHDKQTGLRKRIRDLEAKAKQEPTAEHKRELERLAREQKALQDEASRLARRLERLQAEAAGRSMAGAAGKMSRGGESGSRGDAAGAAEQAEKAERDLEEAQQQLAERRRQAEEDLAREQVARLQDALKSLHERQKRLIEETARLENLRSAAGRFNRAQLGTVNDLARQQKSLETETSLLAEKLSLAEVINLALAGAAQKMARAAELLVHHETGARAEEAQEAARIRFEQLLTAFEQTPKPGDGQQGGPSGQGGGGGGSGGDPAQMLAQLKLLKILQEDLSSRYRTLTARQSNEGDQLAQQLSEIAGEQGKLAELAGKLAAPPEANPEDDPEHLPDVRRGPAGADDVPAPGSSDETEKEPS